MVGGVAARQPFQDVEALVPAGFVNVNALETAGQGAIFLKMIAEFVVGGGAHAAQLAAGQKGLQQVRGVHGSAARGACAHDGMDLVNEQDGVFLALELLHHLLETGLKITAVAAARQHQSQIEGIDGGVGKAVRNASVHDALRQALGHGSLAHSGIAHEERIVLAPAAEHLNGAVELTGTAHKGIKTSLTCLFREIHTKLLERAFLGALFSAFLTFSGPDFGLFSFFGVTVVFPVGVGHKGLHIQQVHALPLHKVHGVALVVLHDRHEKGSKVDLFAACGGHAAHGPFYNLRQGNGLGYFSAHAFRNRLEF